ncbi:MAG: hypothetical protein CMH54_02820 [Myxococcales bacterium]|nr:hypothetical protein [Myxococcales bacterium]|tara:strand:+ start:165 stop:764 length:600 start_codon:yes stop_codon:yes gene_type:complete
MNRHNTTIRYGAVIFLLLMVACGGSKSAIDMRAAGFLEEAKKGNTLTERYDMNADGVVDMEKVYVNVKDSKGETLKLLREKRLDLDYNGKFDLFSRFDSDTKLVSEKIDLDFDGRPDATNLYDKGVLREQQLAPGFDGRVSVWNHYDEKGILVKKGRDTNANGQADTWEYYDGPKLIRIGYDRDGDGRPEYFEDSDAIR